MHRQLGSGTGLSGNALYLDNAVPYLRDLEFKQPLHQSGMRTRQIYLRTLWGPLYIHDIDPYPFVYRVTLPGSLLRGGEDTFRPPQADEHRLVAYTRDLSCYDLSLSAHIIIVYHAPLGLPDALHYHLLRCLGRYPAEIARSDLIFDHIAKLIFRIYLVSLIESKLTVFVHHILIGHHDLPHINIDIARNSVDTHAHILRIAVIFLISRDESRLYGVYKRIL